VRDGPSVRARRYDLRIVSHTGSNTEIVCALGCADLLVGVDDHSDFPVEVVRALPRIGPDLGVDVERVKALEPDLVLTSLTVPGHERVVAALERAGLPLLVLSPRSLADVYGDVERIARALGVEERGRALASRMRDELRAPADAPAARPPACPILVEWWPKPVIVPGKRSWVTDMLAIAGGVNPWADRDCESTPVGDDEVVAAAPRAIVVSWCGVEPEKLRPDVVRRRDAWRGVPAIAEDRVYCVPEAWMGRPGPRLVDGVRALRDIVAAVSEPRDTRR
jgi:iron complex transport system substrate-binding protein